MDALEKRYNLNPQLGHESKSLCEMEKQIQLGVNR